MDIVERLRKPVSKDDPYICTNTDTEPEIKYDLLRSQAADEIERLREALKRIAEDDGTLDVWSFAEAALKGDE